MEKRAKAKELLAWYLAMSARDSGNWVNNPDCRDEISSIVDLIIDASIEEFHARAKRTPNPQTG